MKRWLFVLLVACGGSKPAPTPSPDPTPTGAPLEVEAPASDGGAAPTGTATPEDPSCPPLEQYSASIGKPCPTPDAFCGSARCREAKGFCNIIVCKGGTWQNVEVPPPAPPGVR